MKLLPENLLPILAVTGTAFLSLSACDRRDPGTSAPGVGMTVGTEIDAAAVTTRVKSALLADPGVKSFDIAVVSRKGEVQLSGYVDNRAQIDRVIEIVRGVKGVQKINSATILKK